MAMSDIWYCCGGPGEHGHHNIHHKVVHALSTVPAVQNQLHQARQPELGIWLEDLQATSYVCTISRSISDLHTYATYMATPLTYLGSVGNKSCKEKLDIVLGPSVQHLLLNTCHP